MPRKRNQPTIPTPNREHRGGEGEVLGVVKRAAHKAQYKDDEDNKVTCLDFGADRHREWKDHGAEFCDHCDKYDNLAPEKKHNKRRRQKQYWCTVTGHSKGCTGASRGLSNTQQSTYATR
jgi:hypothetical protein